MRGAFRHVVIGLDGSASARRAAAFVARMRPPARATLVQVVEPVQPPSLTLMPGRVRSVLSAQADAVEAARQRAAERELRRAAVRLRRGGWRARTQVRTGVPINELLAAVASARADLLAVGASGTGGVRRLLLGSIAQGALRRSRAPTLVVK